MVSLAYGCGLWSDRFDAKRALAREYLGAHLHPPHSHKTRFHAQRDLAISICETAGRGSVVYQCLFWRGDVIGRSGNDSDRCNRTGLCGMARCTVPLVCAAMSSVSLTAETQMQPRRANHL